jgi:hypothetical protein
MREDEASLEPHLGQITEAQLIAIAPQDHERDDIGRRLESMTRGAWALMKHTLTITTPKRAINGDIQLGPIRTVNDRGRSTGGAGHLSSSSGRTESISHPVKSQGGVKSDRTAPSAYL